MRMSYKGPEFSALCMAAKHLRQVCADDELYRTHLKGCLEPFTRVGRTIGLSMVKVKCYKEATDAFNEQTRQVLNSRKESDFMVDFIALQARAEQLGFSLQLNQEKKHEAA